MTICAKSQYRHTQTWRYTDLLLSFCITLVQSGGLVSAYQPQLFLLVLPGSQSDVSRGDISFHTGETTFSCFFSFSPPIIASVRADA